jgi:plastocyanin
MRRPSLALAVVLTAALVACAAPASPGWTYAPAPSVTPAPSLAASGSPAASAPAAASPSAKASPRASARASGSPKPSASAGASGSTGLTIIAPVGASTAGYNTTKLEAEAGVAFTITFDNQDTGVPHNFVITKPDGSKVDIGDTAIITGPATATYHVRALDAGEYPYLCEVHPQTMKGVLTIG